MRSAQPRLRPNPRILHPCNKAETEGHPELHLEIESVEEELIIKALTGLMTSQSELAHSLRSEIKEMGGSLQATLQETAMNLQASVDETADKVASSVDKHAEQIQLVIDAIRSMAGTSADLHKKMSDLETKLERMDELERRLKRLEEAS